MKTQSLRYLLSFSAFVGIACLATRPITAAAQTWDGGGAADANWSTATD